MKIYFSADHHFNHAAILSHCDRPWANAREMNEELISRWNEVVPVNGLVYYLGDFGWKQDKDRTMMLAEILERLNGKLYFIRGSHDREAEMLYKRGHPKIVAMTPMAEVHIVKQDVVLCHYAMRTWAKSHYNAWHLHGHSHGRLAPVGKMLDVGVDTHNFYPWSWQEVVEYMSQQPDNFDFVGQKK
ncbi:MAG: hypothetical protein JRI45_06700 [Deltaproteobacteria bacterium]|nr:hypothetical protein [Deltaproteobacteria bacterium]